MATYNYLHGIEEERSGWSWAVVERGTLNEQGQETTREGADVNERTTGDDRRYG